ncbi:predicted protein [Sparassis crispa]|uniref:Uncharacterized protein n=1 Tax=Sparassis crispa TaxID=139825 RepID=A0A401GJI2_9APHY|nr:predicted protein [Sparassis crispa]GBE82328.1 predicted protein [Sparassis crispa]
MTIKLWERHSPSHAPHTTISPERTVGQVSNIERVCRWVIEYPLTTSQRILHLTMPQTDDWSFSPEKHARDIDMDKDIFRYTTFSAAAAPLSPRGCPIPSVTVVIQPPWILSPQDLVAFVGCGALPPYNPHGAGRDYTCSQRLWSKIWDVCFLERSHWFVVTTYFGWVFGAFSKGWTRAFVSPIFKSDEQDPTVEEVLVYWLASAVGVDGGWTIPEVPEPVHTIGLEVVNSIPPPLTRRPPLVPSISDWSGEGGAHMSDTSSAIDAEEVDSMLMDLQDEGDCGSLSGVPNNPIVREKYSHDSVGSVEGIQHWINHVDPTGVPAERPPSPSPSQSSVSTVREYTWNSSREGDWLSVDVRERRYDYVCSG